MQAVDSVLLAVDDDVTLVRPYPVLVTAAKPLLRYYFPNDDDIETWRTEHPFTFDLPLGLRITF